MLPTDLLPYVQSKLGSSSIDVELSQSDIDTAAKDALRQINHYLPLHQTDGVEITPSSDGGQRLDVHVEGAQGVLWVQFINKLQLNLSSAVENPFLLEANIRSTQYGLEAAPYNQYLSGRQDFTRIFSADPEWEARWEVVVNPDTNAQERHLILYVRTPVYTPYRVSWTLAVSYDYSDDLNRGLPAIGTEIEGEFLKYVVAEAKCILSKIYAKFQGIPNPDGADMALDYRELWDEGVKEKDEVVEKLRSMRRQLPPVFG